MRRVLILLILLIAACTAAPTPTPVAQSRVLESWQPQQDALTQADSAREWRFSGQQGDPVHLRLDAKGEVALTLQDANGHTLAQGGDLYVTLPADGIYTAWVQLTSGDSAGYSLTLSYTDRGTPTLTLTAHAHAQPDAYAFRHLHAQRHAHADAHADGGLRGAGDAHRIFADRAERRRQLPFGIRAAHLPVQRDGGGAGHHLDGGHVGER